MVKAIVHDVPISKKRYLHFLRFVAEKVQRAQSKADGTTPQLSEKGEKTVELELKACLSTDDYVVLVNRRGQLAARNARIAVLEE